MSESTTLNGNKEAVNGANTGTKKPRRQRYLPGLPIASSDKDTSKRLADVLVNRTPVEFSSLELYEQFSTVDDGNDPMIKVSRSKAARLSDRKPFPTGGGRVYRVRFENYRNVEDKNQNQGKD
jgi:hypothetical protein